MFDVFYSGIPPNLFAHERRADSIEHAQQLSRTRYFWWINYLTDYSDWDFLWEPVPWQSQYVHAWRSSWDQFHGVCLVPTHAQELQYHYHDEMLPARSFKQNFTELIPCEFDWSWVPHPWDPPYIYVFGNQWYPAEVMPTVEYHTPGAQERKYVAYPRATLHADPIHWTIPENVNVDAFDFSWRPDPGSPPYVYQFGTQWNRAGGPVYTVPGAQDIKYSTVQVAHMLPTDQNWTIPEGIDINSFDFSWTPDPTEPPYIYEFGTQWQKTGGPVYTVPGAQERKYIAQPRATKVNQDLYWHVPNGADVDSFDWTWHPDATEQAYIYQFGTQHQRTGGPQYHVPGATEVKYVDQIRIRTQRVATAIIEIDHLDGNAGQIPDTIKTARYFDNYLDTLKRIAKSIATEHEFVWICSSVCDYKDFDFSWHPEQWQATMLHVFASDGEKFGDTFFMHVPTFLYRSEKLQLLDWYDINFVGVTVPRRPLPVIRHEFDTHVEAVKTMTWSGPLAVFTTDTVEQVPPVPLWREKVKTIVPLSAGASQVIVPKAAVPYIKKQLYDYSHIDRTQRHLHNDKPLDIVFIDNGEPNAEANYQHMCEVVGLTWRNRIHRSTGVTGRVAAYHAAAEKSTTPWFFAVFAKLSVDQDFDWLWQPDRMQEPKHYIFHARNPVNGLEYGHQAMIAYNKRLVLANTGAGLDFTLDSAHEVVPILSGTAYYTDSAWMAWRTAFREVIKLRHSLPNVENEYRLNKWLQENNDNDRARYSHLGAQDAVEYYESVRGDETELRKSYDWSWLASYALLKRNLLPDPQYTQPQGR
jgi:hypothetical protein